MAALVDSIGSKKKGHSGGKGKGEAAALHGVARRVPHANAPNQSIVTNPMVEFVVDCTV
jgi:hypothetical protein